MWIGGAWVDAEGGATFEATSPSTREVIGTVPEGTRADAGRAISAAQAAWPGWASLSAFDRAPAMKRVAEAIDDRREDLAHTLTADRTRGDVRSGRPCDLDPERGGGDRAPRWLAVRPALRDLHARSPPWAAFRRGRPDRLGQRERRDGLLGVAPAVGGRAGSQSGVGRVGGRFSMDRLTELKTIVIDLS